MDWGEWDIFGDRKPGQFFFAHLALYKENWGGAPLHWVGWGVGRLGPWRSSLHLRRQPPPTFIWGGHPPPNLGQMWRPLNSDKHSLCIFLQHHAPTSSKPCRGLGWPGIWSSLQGCKNIIFSGEILDKAKFHHWFFFAAWRAARW